MGVLHLWDPFPLTFTLSKNHCNLLSLSTNPHTNRSRSNRRWFKLEASNSNSNSRKAFDEAAFEAERLALDAEARQAMAAEEASLRDDPKAWKWVIRKRIWDSMEAQNFAQNPRPVHHRIPNFVGASVAADKVSYGIAIYVDFTSTKKNFEGHVPAPTIQFFVQLFSI